MKVLSSTILLLGLLITLPTASQNRTNIETLLERLDENHMGSVLDVFTLEELQQLKEHFAIQTVGAVDLENSSVLLNRRLAASQVVIPVRIVSIEPDNLTDFLDFGPSGLPEFEGAGFVRGNPVNEAVVIDNTNRVYVRGIEDNNFVDNGIISNVPPGESITGVETVVGRTDQVFGVSTNGVDSSHLLRINTNNFEAEVIGGNNGLIVPIALASDGGSMLITIDIDDDIVYSLDIETGMANVIGPLGYNANFGQGMAFDPFSGQILNAAYNGSLGDSELRVIDPITGMSTSLGTIKPGSLDQFGWIGPYDSDLLSSMDTVFADFAMYPNPTTDLLHLKAGLPIQSVGLFNLAGQQLVRQSMDERSSSLDLSFLASGMYLVQVEINNEKAHYKLVKN
jgi:hypothetical protein